MIVATAGHVDHGKTTLVRALTGQDTDRLPEEKRRGMSIDLGFAFLAVPGAEPIAFVDVPGHERFIRNMAAGVHGVDLALLAVAADDGPMPQTLEHLEILELLGARALLAVITKTDRVAPERVDEVVAEVGALLRGRRFGQPEIVRVSAATGENMEVLKRKLIEHRARARKRDVAGALFRMNVDREFVIDGLGLVVTGTVLSGSIAPGDGVFVLPGNRKARIRSVRANGGEAAGARAGERCALALQGLSRGEVARGDTVVTGDEATCSRYLDVAVSMKTPPKRASVTVHLGTRTLPARIAPLGAGRLARLTFGADVAAWHGERFLLRDSGSRKLLGGGEVIDPLPPARGAAKPARLALLESVVGKDAEQALDALLAHGAVEPGWFARAWHLPGESVRRLAAARGLVAEPGFLMRPGAWSALCEAIERDIGDWHAAEPEWIGIRAMALGKRHGDSEPFRAAVALLVEEKRVVREGPHLRLPGHRPVLAAQDEALWHRVGPLLAGSEGRPPRVHELAQTLQMEPKAVSAFLERCARAGLACRIAANRFFLPAAVTHLANLAYTLDGHSGGAGFSAATYRDASGLGRNLTIQVLEFLDQAGYTRRAGELRRSRLGTTIDASTEEQRTPVGRPDFKSGERRQTPLASSTPASSATNP